MSEYDTIQKVKETWKAGKIWNLRPIDVGLPYFSSYMQPKIWRCASTDGLGQRYLDSSVDETTTTTTGSSTTTTTATPTTDDIVLKHASLLIDLRHSRERDDRLAKAWTEEVGMRVVTYDPDSDINEYMMNAGGKKHERTVLRVDILSPSRLVSYVAMKQKYKDKQQPRALALFLSKDKSKQQKRKLVMEWMKKRGIVGLNQAVLECGKNEFCFILREITKTIESGGTVVMSCVQGKDRTGCVALLIQSCLLLEDQIIVDDYHLSEAYLQNLNAEAAHATARQAMARCFNRSSNNQIVFRAPKEAMLEVLYYLRRKYGSTDGYLDSIGFDKSWRMRLREAVLNKWYESQLLENE